MNEEFAGIARLAAASPITKEIIDIVDKLVHSGNFAKRSLDRIDGVMFHHSGSLMSKGYTPYDFAEWHTDPNGRMKAPRICYHYSIEDDGTIYKVNELDQIAWHAGNYDYNTRYIGVEFNGNFVKEMPKPAQLTSGIFMYSYLKNLLKKDLFLCGHNETPDPKKPGRFVATACPGTNMKMDELRKILNARKEA